MLQPSISASERPRPEPSEGCEGEAVAASDGEPTVPLGETEGSPEGAAAVGSPMLDDVAAGAEASLTGVAVAATPAGPPGGCPYVVCQAAAGSFVAGCGS